MIEDTRIITNSSRAMIDVWFEPWGIVHRLPPGEAFLIAGKSDQDGMLEIVESEKSIAVYGWVGSTLAVYHGDTLVDEFNTVFPELPSGMTVRSFVEFLFGGAGGH
jgi:hypothetical protein